MLIGIAKMTGQQANYAQDFTANINGVVKGMNAGNKLMTAKFDGFPLNPMLAGWPSIKLGAGNE